MAWNRCLKLFNPSRRAYTSLRNDGIIVTRQNDKAILQFNRTDKRNAMSVEMQYKFGLLMREFESDSTVSAVIIKGNETGFSAGGDIGQFLQIIQSDKKYLYDRGMEFFRGLLRLSEYSKPVISLADKICIGQGAAVAFTSSHPVVTERTLFTLPEVFVGTHNVGATYLLAQLPNNFGMWVGLTGARFLGSDIINLNLTKNYVKSTDLGRLESALINLQETNFETVSHTIAQFQQDCDKWSIDPDGVKHLFSGCSVEEIVENLKADDSEFASQILQTFSHVSPTALKLIFNIIRVAQLNQYSNNDVFSADYSLFKNFLDDTDGNDFKEGIRSVVIDKTHKPNWIPKTLQEVDDRKLIQYFTTNVIDVRASCP